MSSVLRSGLLFTGLTSSKTLSWLRIAIGILFLIFAEYKVFEAHFTHGGFEEWIRRFLQEGAYPFMAPVLRGFVLPHAKPIAYLVAYGEAAIGLSLALGIWVRLASVSGVIYMLSLLFSSNYPGPGVALWQYFGASLDHLVLALCFATFVITKPREGLSVRTGSRKP